jgi:hypothetical protein
VVDGAAISIDEARKAWAVQARERLVEVAHSYHAVITYQDLADEVQERSGIRTRMLMMHWIGGVLGAVTEECGRRAEPTLSSLCVHQDGTVGDGYGVAVQAAYGIAPDDLDGHAANERLACNRHFGAVLPADGGRSALTPAVEARRDRAAAQRPERRGQVCPTCFTELPVTGACGRCAD